MKMAQVRWTNAPEDLVRFQDVVERRLAGQARRKANGCRAGHFVVRDEAVEAFAELAASTGVEVYLYAPEELERPGRMVG